MPICGTMRVFPLTYWNRGAYGTDNIGDTGVYPNRHNGGLLMKWYELNDVMHDNELEESDDDVIVYEFDTGDFHDTDVIEFDEHGIYISINNEENDDE
jgi:hypothetical protein